MECHLLRCQLRAPILVLGVLVLALIAKPATAEDGLAPANSEVEQAILLGQTALANGHPDEAILIFEEVLLKQPERLGVWVDYALALRQIGDDASAIAIYQTLRLQNPPEQLKAWLDEQLSRPPKAPHPWRYSGELGVQTGIDGNLNRAPSGGSLTLTLLSGPVTLPMAPSSQPVAGGAQLVHLTGIAQYRDWEIQAAINARNVSTDTAQNYLQSTFGLIHQFHMDNTRHYQLMFALQNLQYGGLNEQQLMRTGVYQHQPANNACELNHGLEWERLLYPMNGTLNGNYFGLAAEYGCQQKIAWQTMVRAGIDKEDYGRAGGDQKRFEIREQLAGVIGGNSWLIQIGHNWSQDFQGYNVWLSNNAQRTIIRHSLKLQFRYSINHHLNATLSGEVYNQASNLELFVMSGNSLWTGINYILE